ncbi:MAG: murein biosynthesis integral membrane protein MurJ [Chlamydiota bacterium]|nr:murein biosynthesis integral membrane protein MurJ [Chlamydiota bacterium]
MQDTKQSIFKAAKSFLSGTLISRFTGLLRDVAMAFAFGTSGAIAALMIAFRFSHMFRRLLGEGAFQMAFIPQFETLRKKSSKRAIYFFRSLTFTMSLLLLFLIIASCATLLSCYWSLDLSAGTKEILLLTTILMPGLFFICLYGLNSALLQCEQSYFTPSVAPVAFNCVWIIGTLSLMQLGATEAMPWLAGFIVLACAGQWMITLPQTIKIYKKHAALPSTIPQRSFFSGDVRKLIKPLTLSVIGVAATQINNTLDPIFARFADSEGPAFLWYAIRLQQFPIALFGIALSSAILPPLSRAIKNDNIEKYKSFLETAVRKSLLFMIPITFAYFVAGDTCVNLLFGHGDFGTDSVKATTICLLAYTCGLIPCALILILAPGFYALNNYRGPTVITSMSVLVNILLNATFVLYFNWGAASVALATSVSAWFNFTCLWLALQKEVGSFATVQIIKTLLKSLSTSFISVFMVLIVNTYFFNGNGVFAIFNGKNLRISHHFFEQLTRFLFEASAFGIPVVLMWLHEFKPSIFSFKKNTVVN